MTVKELIEKLKECNENAKVVVEGCDCTADATGIYKEVDLNVIYITRENGVL